MIKALIIIRLKQIFRGLIGIGLLRLIFLVGLISTLGFALFVQTSKTTNAYYVSIGFSILIGLVQVKRKDKLFLKCHFLKYKLINSVEYSIASIPILICLVYHKQWIPIIILILCNLIFVHLDYSPKQSNLNTRLQQLIPPDSFEWKAGARKLMFFIIPLWIIGLATSLFIGSIPIVIFIIGISIYNFYERCEPYQIIIAYEKSSKSFLMHKIKRQTVLFSALIIPLIIPFLFFHFDKWYIPIAVYIIFIFLHIYLILTKYAFYDSNKKSPAAQTFNAIGALSGLIPIFLPFVWLLSIRFYFKSINNLNNYLNDYN